MFEHRARDLGFELVAVPGERGRRRVLKARLARFGRARGRLAVVRRLVKQTRRARCLVRPAVLSLGFWGVEAGGVRPSHLESFRAAVVSAIGSGAVSEPSTTTPARVAGEG